VERVFCFGGQGRRHVDRWFWQFCRIYLLTQQWEKVQEYIAKRLLTK